MNLLKFQPMKEFLKISLAFLLFPMLTYGQSDPVIHFTDLISGPDTGLGDSLGSGVIVTVWGQNLGDTQGTSTIIFKNSAGVSNTPYVYYWKRADGQLPGGPSNLYESHRMQEIAFSIPDTASGAGTIRVDVGGNVSNTLPFTVRSGSIYHVKSNGNDSSGNGSFSSPWKTVGKADSTAGAGSTIYVHGITTGGPGTDRAIYWNNGSASSTLAAQFTITSYPGTQSIAQGTKGFTTYRTSALSVSKYKVFASRCDDIGGQPRNCESANGGDIGIEGSANGRAVANTITDQPGGCASKYQGAISGSARSEDHVSNYKMYGNEIYDYGCEGTAKFHHTTYMSIRSQGANKQLVPWEFGWNYLHGNKAKNGIHMYDENAGCGDLTNTILIHDNVIIDQGGAGISVGSNCGWSMDVEIYNNVLINVALAAAWDGIDPGTSDGPDTGAISIYDGGLHGQMRIFNNVIHKWNDDDNNRNSRGCLGFANNGDNVSVVWNDNICYTEKDVPFIGASSSGANKLDNVTGNNNVYYYSGSNPTNATPPTWDANAVTVNPLLTINGAKISVSESSPVNGIGATTLTHDVYGVSRGNSPEIGAIEIGTIENGPLPTRPNPPTDMTVGTQ